MNKYEQLSRKALGIAFIAGPLLLTVGALTFLLGIGLNENGVTSWLEGILDAYALLIFVPIYFGLARLMGERAPRLGIVCAITGLGIGFGAVPSSYRILQAGLDQAGYDIAIFSITHSGSIALILWMFLGMFTSLILGIGFLRYGGIPRWTAVLLILAPILFLMGQGGDESIALWRVKIIYPLACITWLISLGSIGLRYLGGSVNNLAEQQDVKTAVS